MKIIKMVDLNISSFVKIWIDLVDKKKRERENIVKSTKIMYNLHSLYV